MEKNENVTTTSDAHTLILVCTRRWERELRVAGDGAVIGAPTLELENHLDPAKTPSSTTVSSGGGSVASDATSGTSGAAVTPPGAAATATDGTAYKIWR
ncbi:hypothetical protein PIB30_030339 [Stylosanthes scabra]|uniref:Uncharacterized protein n=1 Tax=Stylosanthes scabra TaxID=79078 RepID=A0ABU6UAR0_9FABA|nr:hypothetical protein [Stylosanthes scabra]